jgi:diadenosine tetraphosphate (Ap4A) HIT family hydrolase
MPGAPDDQTPSRLMRSIAIDWSGAERGARKRIWLAEVRDERLIRLEGGRSRAEIICHLIDEANRDPHLVIGLDFAFSFPRWFLHESGIDEPLAIWDLAAAKGEGWLAGCDPPFWGRPGRRRPEGVEQFRVSENEISRGRGAQPKSVFQIGGAGAVGTGSIRGMPFLAELTRAGFAVWPFHPPRLPMVIEIYPRLLTGAVVKSDPAVRKAYLAGSFPEMDAELRELAATSEDALDAAVSAVVMARHGKALLGMTGARDETEALEGRIWVPDEMALDLPSTDGVGSPASDAPCSFCATRERGTLMASDHALAVADAYPLTEGHTLVMPRRHVPSVFDLEDAALRDLWQLVGRVRDHLLERYAPDAFTIGVNDGEAAGQTVSHAHVHVIPRRKGDVPDPRGGVRWVVPERARYWEP